VAEDRFSRQVLAFGEFGQQHIAKTHAAVVGVGGLGSQVAQALAYLGTGEFTLIDDDRIEPSNLNRLIGATVSDLGQPKVSVVAAAVCRINHDAKVRAIASNLRSRAALTALQDASVVFGCVDNDGARLVLTEFCCAYQRLYIDSATEILRTEHGGSIDFGGRVVASVPGEFCLSCGGELDMEAAKVDLESSAVREARQRHGYGVADVAAAPSVVSLNGIVANIAVTEFMASVTGLRPPNTKSTYRGMRGVVQVSLDKRKPGCVNCEYLTGKGQAAEVLRYVVE
jgi:molybdopterin/thiamine biosynthesis adenylyltransferase